MSYTIKSFVRNTRHSVATTPQPMAEAREYLSNLPKEIKPLSLAVDGGNVYILCEETNSTHSTK